MEQKTAIQEMDETAKRCKEEKLTEAVKLVQEEIRACRERYRKIANGEEHSPIMIEGETETGYPCELMADPKTVAKVYLKYDFPTWSVLEDDAPCAMWDELAETFGLKVVGSADL